VSRRDEAVRTCLTAAARQILTRHPEADQSLVAGAIMDAYRGMTLFGYRDEELTASAIAEVAVCDPRLARATRGSR
jgi:hypothetical protein